MAVKTSSWWSPPENRAKALVESSYLNWMGHKYDAYQILVALAADINKKGDDFYDEELEKKYTHPENRP